MFLLIIRGIEGLAGRDSYVGAILAAESLELGFRVSHLCPFPPTVNVGKFYSVACCPARFLCTCKGTVCAVGVREVRRYRRIRVFLMAESVIPCNLSVGTCHGGMGGGSRRALRFADDGPGESFARLVITDH